MTTQELAKLTPEQKRIRIAELCGWTDIGEPNGCFIFGREKPNHLLRRRLPDYLDDLNAMHEAEKVMFSKGLGQRYIDNLRECIPSRNSALLYHATAAQRADAFLLTLG